MQLRRVMIYEGMVCIGFSECALVERPEMKQCRICLEGSEDGPLLEACACRGSMAHIHSLCAVRQWEARGKPECLNCGLCKQPFTGQAAKALAAASQRSLESRRRDQQPDLPNHEQNALLMAQVSTATLLWREGQLEEAAKAFNEALDGLQKLHGEKHTNTCTAHHNLGLVLLAQNHLQEAGIHIRKARLGFIAEFGERHSLVLKARHNEALITYRIGKWQEAAQAFEEVLVVRREVLGAEHIDTLKTLCNLGLTLHNLHRDDEAVEMLQDALRGLEQVVGRQHSLALATMQNLSLAMSPSKPEEAVRLGREAANGRQLAGGADNPETLEGWRDLGIVLDRAGQHTEAEEVWKRALQGQEKAHGFTHPATRQTLALLKEALLRRGEKAAAQSLADEHEAGVAVVASPAVAVERRGAFVAVLLSIYLLPQHRRRGLGKAAMELWKNFARAASAEALEVRLVGRQQRSKVFLGDHRHGHRGPVRDPRAHALRAVRSSVESCPRHVAS